MEFLWVIAVFMVFLGLKGYYDKKKEKERLLVKLQEQWGCIPEESYSENKMESLQYYYRNIKKDSDKNCFYLDDITWNDLNLTELFYLVNSTGSAMGEEVLWAMLHELQLSNTPLEKREHLISFFQNNKEARLKLQKAFTLIGKHKNISVYEYMDRIDRVSTESNTIHYVGLAGIAVSLILLFCSVAYAGIILLAFILFNIITYYRRKGEIEVYYSVISYLMRMLEHASQISEEDIPELQDYLVPLRQHTTSLKKFRKGAPVVISQNPTGDMMSFFLDYIRIIFHTDLIRFNRMIKQYFQKKELLVDVFEIIGFLDAMCGVASFRTWLPGYCCPEFVNETSYQVKELYHPFLQNPVPASVSTRQSLLITGSNASGKSTFLKAAAINAILAQTIHTVCAEAYRASYFQIMTSMALNDNLFANESYYIVEIKSLKRIIEATTAQFPVLCFVDEVLRGTNTVERIAASSRILHSIAHSNALMFAATHDIELTYMLEHCFTNYHFEEVILNDTISFDYQLKEGRATSQNAIALLGMLGYPEEIIVNAKKTAEHFLKEGEWKSI